MAQVHQIFLHCFYKCSIFNGFWAELRFGHFYSRVKKTSSGSVQRVDALQKLYSPLVDFMWERLRVRETP